jgi:hypothetical protein
MDKRRSFYLASKQDDSAEPPADASRLDFNDIPFITPVNDNVRTKDRLSARCGSLLRRLLARHSLGRPKKHEQRLTVCPRKGTAFGSATLARRSSDEFSASAQQAVDQDGAVHRTSASSGYANDFDCRVV